MFRAVCVRRPGRHASARRAPDGATSMPGAAGVRVGGARRGRRDDAGQLGDGEPRAAGGDDRRPGGATAPVTPMRGAGCGGKTALAGDDRRFPRLWRCICPCFSAGALVSRRMRMPWPGAGCADRRRRVCGVRRRVASTPRTGSHIRSPPRLRTLPRAVRLRAAPRRRRHRGRPARNIIGGQVIAPRTSWSDRAPRRGCGYGKPPTQLPGRHIPASNLARDGPTSVHSAAVDKASGCRCMIFFTASFRAFLGM